jgi:hypothetical protein
VFYAWARTYINTHRVRRGAVRLPDADANDNLTGLTNDVPNLAGDGFIGESQDDIVRKTANPLKGSAIFLMWIPAICDLTGTTVRFLNNYVLYPLVLSSPPSLASSSSPPQPLYFYF